ncbi:conserved hypothetical protein [Roseibium sp. TrichSKD4]|uniref:TAXI family TRAP transporter solute-binding subunit n=1 Tax=Roseibium sp. TrichSKD4 TaxID=744980 RepID=UPI0001E57074|nr:TAXI family TRAP transporter solute-binding subunit [Roseibium sp. TrichSKD4]EFO31673.1 conserved hypothetical protein [Roseibium sp. TrichSKD4]
MKRNLFLISAFTGLIALCLPSAFAQDLKPPISICSGTDGGSYYLAAKAIADSLAKEKITSEVLVDTGGSLGNISRALRGECNVLVSQPDAMVNLKRNDPASAREFVTVASLHEEYLILLVNRDGKVGELDDLESYGKEASIVLGDPDFSGAVQTWANLVAEDDDYGAVRIASEHDDPEFALEALAQGEVDAILLVTRIKANRALSEANSYLSKKLRIGAMNDGDVDDAVDLAGDPLLVSVGVPSNGITSNLTSCFFGCTDSYKMQAKLYLVKGSIDRRTEKTLRRVARRVGAQIQSALN